MTDQQELAQQLRQAYQDAPRRDAWHIVAGVAARYYTRKYAPLVAAYTMLMEGPDRDGTDVQGEDGRGAPGIAGEAVEGHSVPEGR